MRVPRRTPRLTLPNGSPFSSTQIIRLPSPRPRPLAAFYPRLAFIHRHCHCHPSPCPVLRNDCLTRARVRTRIYPCTHRHLPVMLPSTRHAVYPIYLRGVIIINHVNFTITDVPVPRRRQKRALCVLKAAESLARESLTVETFHAPTG